MVRVCVCDWCVCVRMRVRAGMKTIHGGIDVGQLGTLAVRSALPCPALPCPALPALSLVPVRALTRTCLLGGVHRYHRDAVHRVRYHSDNVHGVRLGYVGKVRTLGARAPSDRVPCLDCQVAGRPSCSGSA